MFGGFGQQTQQNAQAPATGFNFGAATGAPAAPSTGFSFGGTTQTTAPAAGSNTGFAGFGLGNPAAATSTAATTAAGSGFGAFNFGAAATAKPAAPAAAAPTAGGFNFGLGQTAPQAPTQPTQAPAATGLGFNFGGAATVPTVQQTAATAAVPVPTATPAFTSAATGLGSTGGGFFGMKAPGSTTTAANAPGPGLGGFTGGFGSTASTTSAGSVLGGLLSAPSTAAATTVAATTTPSQPTGFSLGTTPASSAATSGFNLGAATTAQASTAPTLTGGLGLGGFGSSIALPTPASTSATTTTASSTVGTTAATLGIGGGPKQMTFRQLEDTINKWTTGLEEQERYFLDQATQVNAWDRIVMENGEKIIHLNKDVERVKLDQQKLDHELDFVRSQQKELEDLLDPLEKALDGLPPISHQQHTHLEREHTYMLAESLDTQLKRMGQDLKEILERLNSNTSKPESNDPVHQITKILNAHVVSLMWVDRNAADLQHRVEDIGKLMESEKREQERNFRLAYS